MLHICQILVDLKVHQSKCKLYSILFFQTLSWTLKFFQPSKYLLNDTQMEEYVFCWILRWTWRATVLFHIFLWSIVRIWDISLKCQTVLRYFKQFSEVLNSYQKFQLVLGSCKKFSELSNSSRNF